MECQRDEAAESKAIAERKFSENDLLGAKEYALKAQKLNPELEGISQLLTILDVHIAAGIEINGITDFYAILQLDPWAKKRTVKKQYRRLAVILHPDKNRSFGADGAFKYVSEAWNVLSDQSRRSQYDQKRNLQSSVTSHRKASQSSSKGAASFCTSSHVAANVGNNSLEGTASSASHTQTSEVAYVGPPQSSSHHQLKSLTFWTECTSCRMQYEYLRIYLNYRLICRNCRSCFLAIEIAVVPVNGSDATFNWSLTCEDGQSDHKQLRKPNSTAKDKGMLNSTKKNCTMNDFHETLSGLGKCLPQEMAQNTERSVKRRKAEKGFCAYEEEALSAVGNGSSIATVKPPGRKRNKLANSGQNMCTNPSYESDGPGAVQQNGLSNGKPSNQDDVRFLVKRSGAAPAFDTRKLLIDKARMDIRKRLEEMKSAQATETAEEKPKPMESLQFKVVKFTGFYKDKLPKADDSVGASEDELDLLKVPDPDFYDFDKHRMENCFRRNQIWALYDSDDGMPRIYAKIRKVISLIPFKVEISYLNGKGNDEFAPVTWVNHRFAKSCGNFKVVEKLEMIDQVNVFSHIVHAEIQKRKKVQIFPRKGDTWAIYKNWSADWSSCTPAVVRHKYEMVEVLEDYREREGTCVVPLVKVAGFRTVYGKDMDPNAVRWIPRNEMLQFSHQVPSWNLTEAEAKNMPNGCRDLDTAATPQELLYATAGAESEITSAS
ncbi:Curved DNA-binding protein [Nymphaea thermarum]|nr:Curved DNA-binding protein [Nymphaea thermarum]